MTYNRNRKQFEIDCDLDIVNHVSVGISNVGLNLLPKECPCGKKFAQLKVSIQNLEATLSNVKSLYLFQVTLMTQMHIVKH